MYSLGIYSLLKRAALNRLSYVQLFNFVCMQQCFHLWYCAWRNWNSSLILSQESEVVNFSCCDEACKNIERKTLEKSYWEPCWKRKEKKQDRWGVKAREARDQRGEIIKNTNMKSNSFQFATVQRAKHYEEIGCQACFQVRRAKWKPPKLCACSKTETSKLNVPASFLNPCKRTVLLHTRTQTWPTQRYN